MENNAAATIQDVSNVPLPLNGNDPLFAPHFQSLMRGDLLIRQCTECSTMQWPPRPFCRDCQAMDFSWIKAPRRGTVASFSVAYRAFHPAYVDRLPAATVLVDVAPGIRIAGRWTGAIDEITIGQQAELIIDRWAEHGVSAAWKPSDAC